MERLHTLAHRPRTFDSDFSQKLPGLKRNQTVAAERERGQNVSVSWRNVMHVPEGFAVVTPYIFADGAEKYVRFLEAAFGAREVGRSTAPNGRIPNCQLQFGTTTIMVSEASEQFPASRAALYLYVADAKTTMSAAERPVPKR